MTVVLALRADMDSDRIPARQLAVLAAKQHGVFTRAQGSACGLPLASMTRRLSTGAWDPLYPGVYRLAGTPATWLQSLMAASLAWGEGAVVSHRAAAALRDLPGFPRGVIELSIPRARRRAFDTLVHRPKSLDAIDVSALHGIPVTTTERTLIDLAECCDADTVEEALDDALRRRLVSVRRLAWRVQEVCVRGRAGSVLIRDLVEARAAQTVVPQSRFETRLVRVLRRAGLPDPVLQYQVRTPMGLAVIDAAYPAIRLAIEADGFRWHSSRRQWDHDRERRNALTDLGWTVVHVTWSQLEKRPGEVVELIRSLLIRTR